jgi:lipoprotein-anchoring transpeptidase ErfK/SrfK
MFSKIVANSFLILGTLFFVSCQPNQNGSANQPVQPAANVSNTAVNTSSATTNNTASANAAMPVTMPLIDAMFADDAFVQEARSAVQLTDEELNKLRDAARNNVLELGGDPAEDTNRSTRTSVEKTRTEIEKILGQQRGQQFLNFVRERWQGNGEELALSKPNAIPTDTRVVVNAPAYRMDIFKDGQLVKTYKVGIGYPEFPLPTGLRRASEIIFNPTWTPPDEPWVEGKVQPGKTVEAGSKLNPLGPIKIPIGLPSLIHGGKDPSRLGTFASHGCVGLTSPMVQDFAVQLASLSGMQLTPEDVKGYAKQKTETKNVKLDQPVPVELRYETIVVENGKLYIYRDVYERGTNTEENLRRVLDSYGVAWESLAESDRGRMLDALDQMAVDAKGDAVEPGSNANSNTNSNKNTSGKVTRNVKGQKEVVVELAALQGKGYPAPVDLSAK